MIKNKENNLLAKVSMLFFGVGLISIIVKGFMPEWVDSSGLLHEPYFFMLPLGFASLFLGLILGTIALIKSMSVTKK